MNNERLQQNFSNKEVLPPERFAVRVVPLLTCVVVVTIGCVDFVSSSTLTDSVGTT